MHEIDITHGVVSNAAAQLQFPHILRRRLVIENFPASPLPPPKKNIKNTKATQKKIHPKNTKNNSALQCWMISCPASCNVTMLDDFTSSHRRCHPTAVLGAQGHLFGRHFSGPHLRSPRHPEDSFQVWSWPRTTARRASTMNSNGLPNRLVTPTVVTPSMTMNQVP